MLKKYDIFLVSLIIMISRLAFINTGYGSEEDAFGMAITARNIAETGIYEYSRLPGHPVPELIYSLIAHFGSFSFNLLTAIISTTGILFFMISLKKSGIAVYAPAGLALAFTPVVYIASTNCMDYTWAMAFMLISFYLLLVNKPVLAGMALGIAIGCRITSLAMLLPFFFVCREQGRISYKGNLQFLTAGLLTGIILYMPAINRYGFSFLDFYDTSYPSFGKALYKFTIAVYGTIGFLIILYFKLGILKNMRVTVQKFNLIEKLLLGSSLLIFIIHALLFWYIPQKAAFMIPAIPFVILIFAIMLSKKQLMVLTGCLVFSCFFCGFNLSDPYRGGRPSALALPLNIGNQRAVFDPLVGNVSDDMLKRKQRELFTERVFSLTDTITVNAALIAGWWLGDILASKHLPNKKLLLIYYANENKLSQLKQQDYVIYYLPEQDIFNDEKYGAGFTTNYAIPLIPD